MEINATQGSLGAAIISDSFIQIINAQGQEMTVAQAQEYEQQYLKRVMLDCAGLEWLALVQQQDEHTPRITLDSVYTALLTTSIREADKAQEAVGEAKSSYSALQMLNRESRLVLIGAPGSGKSAFVNFLALCMAGELIKEARCNLATLTHPLPDDEGQPQKENQSWQHGALVPVRVILRDFVASKSFPAQGEKGESSQLMAFINSQFNTNSHQDYIPILESRLRRGEVLLLMDGLDEVPKAGETRERMIECIQGFHRSHSDSRILITARPYAYEKDVWQLKGFADTILADFSAAQIRLFISRWYTNRPEFDESASQDRVKKLKQAIFDSSSLQALAQRPLLLTLMAFLHSHRHELPERRADLYEILLELLIEKWEKARFNVEDASKAHQREQYSLAEFLQVGADAIRKVLERLAFAAHAGQREQSGTADISAKDLSHQLLCLAQTDADNRRKPVDALAISEYLRDRVGILYQRGGESEVDAVYTFPHRSFQEYLSAAYFRREENALFELYPDDRCDEWQDLAAALSGTDPDRWREVVILAGGIKAHQEPGPVWNLLSALVPEKLQGQSMNTDQAWRLRLAGEILAENMKLSDLIPKHQRIMARIRDSLPCDLVTSKLSVTERACSGQHLAKIGDPRHEVIDVDAMQFFIVPEGTFFLGSTDSDEWAYSSEKIGAGWQPLDYSFAVSRFPVTVAQFRQFVRGGSFQPGNSDCLRGLDNTPVAWVTWREAVAFCDWLTERWRQKSWLADDWRVDLASEPEWEKAARGGEVIPKVPEMLTLSREAMQSLHCEMDMQHNTLPQRRFPWGNKADKKQDRMNFDMSIGHASSVGIFPSGASPYGAEEMTGNVWEWTRSLYDEPPYPVEAGQRKVRESRQKSGLRVLRGGAFHGDRLSARCSARISHDPDYRRYAIGFRVVLALPFTHKSPSINTPGQQVPIV